MRVLTKTGPSTPMDRGKTRHAPAFQLLCAMRRFLDLDRRFVGKRERPPATGCGTGTTWKSLLIITRLQYLMESSRTAQSLKLPRIVLTFVDQSVQEASFCVQEASAQCSLNGNARSVLLSSQ
ncbi:uncharacterized [Tachysurus ichikawai]